VERLVIAAAVVVIAVVVARVVASRRGADAPTQPRHRIPEQLDPADLERLGCTRGGWSVVIFTSASCSTCADVVTKAEVVRSPAVSVAAVSYQDHRDLHERYDIDAVPALVIVDGDGVVHAAFLGPVSATDLWAAVAEAREPGSVRTPGTACGAHDASQNTPDNPTI